MRRIAGMAMLSAAACMAAPGLASEQATQDAIPTTVAPAMEEVLTMRVDGQIAVDATGAVSGYALKTNVEPRVRELIDKAVPQWLFLPPMIDGKASAAKTGMRITLLGRKVADGYEISIDNVLFSRPDHRDWNYAKQHKPSDDAQQDGATRFSMSFAKRRPLPNYPKFNVNGMVTILVNVSLEGQILDAVATQCSLYQASGSPMELKRACKAMEDNATRAIRQWAVAIDDHGKPLAFPTVIATIPVMFKRGEGAGIVARASEPGHWRLESRTPYHLPEWARGERFAQRMGTSDAVGGELMSSESPLRLRDGQLGTVL